MAINDLAASNLLSVGGTKQTGPRLNEAGTNFYGNARGLTGVNCQESEIGGSAVREKKSEIFKFPIFQGCQWSLMVLMNP